MAVVSAQSLYASSIMIKVVRCGGTCGTCSVVPARERPAPLRAHRMSLVRGRSLPHPGDVGLPRRHGHAGTANGAVGTSVSRIGRAGVQLRVRAATAEKAAPYLWVKSFGR